MARIPRFDGGETAGHTEEDPEARPPADAADVDSAIAELGRAASDAIVRVYKWTRDAASQESTSVRSSPRSGVRPAERRGGRDERDMALSRIVSTSKHEGLIVTHRYTYLHAMLCSN
jgi:hypothetical protein